MFACGRPGAVSVSVAVTWVWGVERGGWMLFGVLGPPDTIDVEELPGQDGPFAVRHSIVQFEKRMKVSGEVAFEFIARGTPPPIRFPSPRPTEYRFAYLFSPLGRMWKPRFYVKWDASTHQPGPWAVRMHMMEQSPPTHLDSRIIIKEPAKEPLNPPPAAPPNRGLASFLTSSSSSPKSTPPIESRLKSSAMELTAVRAGRKPEYSQRVQALFTDSVEGNSLQYP